VTAVDGGTTGIARGRSVRGMATGVASDEVSARGALPGDGTTMLVTASQLAERWQVPVRTVYAWARRNAIPHYRAGRMLRFDPLEVEEHFRAHGYAAEIRADPQHPGESAFVLLSE
jgi:excisionase family DNA binding protein